MINTDRIVPVQAIDLISLYGLILKQDSDNATMEALKATNPAQFDVATNSKIYLADEPVAFCDFNSGVTAGTVYFVPAYDYAGFSVAGAEATIADGSDDVVADGRTLYSAVLATGEVAITKLGF